MLKKINNDLSSIKKTEDKIKYLEWMLKKTKDEKIKDEIKILIQQFKSQLEESEIERKIDAEEFRFTPIGNFNVTKFPEVEEEEAPIRVRRNRVAETPVVEAVEEEREIRYIPALKYSPPLENTTPAASLYTTSITSYETALSDINLREDEIRQIKRLGSDVEKTSAEQRAIFRGHIRIDSIGDHLDNYLNAERNPLREYQPLKSAEDVRTSGFIKRDIKEREEGVKYIKKMIGEA